MSSRRRSRSGGCSALEALGAARRRPVGRARRRAASSSPSTSAATTSRAQARRRAAPPTGSLAPPMEVITDLAACPVAADGAVVTIGVYDGVHLGHRALIGEVRGLAAELGLRHRGRHLRPSPGHRRAPRVGAAAAHRPRPEARAAGRRPASTTRSSSTSTRSGRAESAEDFVDEVLVGCLRRQAVVVGEDFHFGREPRRQRRRCCSSMGAEPRLRRRAASTLVAAMPASTSRCRRPRIRTLLGRRATWPAAAAPARPAARGAGRRRARRRAGARARLPDRQRRRARRRSCCRPTASTPAGTSGPTGRSTPTAISLGRRPTFYERRRRLAARGLPPRLRRRPLRRAGRALRRPAARRGALRVGRRPRRPDGPRRRRRPPGPRGVTAERRRRPRPMRVVMGLLFFPARRLGPGGALPRPVPFRRGWTVSLVTGSLGVAGEETHAPTFFAGSRRRARARLLGAGRADASVVRGSARRARPRARAGAARGGAAPRRACGRPAPSPPAVITPPCSTCTI